MAGHQGLSQDSSMSDADREKITKAGGKASGGNTTSHSTGSTASSDGTITNKSGGGALDKDAQKRGGENSHRS
jgi:hypothetical protein